MMARDDEGEIIAGPGGWNWNGNQKITKGTRGTQGICYTGIVNSKRLHKRL